MRAALLALGAAGLAALSSPAFADSEDSLREQIETGAAQLLQQGNLAEYDRQATALRESRELTPAGIWKLSLFYRSADHLAPNAPHAAAWVQVESTADAYLRAHPDSAAALMAEVRVLNAHAEELRDGGGGSQDLDLAAANTRRARELLEQHRQTGSRDPDWYVNRIVVNSFQEASKAEVMELAAEALEREPTYQPLLYAASSALLPQHGGSKALHQQFVALALAKSREKLGTQVYGRIMFDVVRSGTDPLGALAGVGMDWPTLRYSLAEIAAVYPDPWNANAERAMACLLGSEADFHQAADRVPRPAFAVAWYDRTSWPDCAANRQNLQSSQQASQTRETDSALGMSVSVKFLATVAAAVCLCLVILRLVRNRTATRQPVRSSVAVPGTDLSPSIPWRIGQGVMAVMLGVIGLAGMLAFGCITDLRDSPLALAITFVCSMLACGGCMLMVNAIRFYLVLRADGLEVHQLSGVRVFSRAELAARRTVTVQGIKYLELQFKDPQRKPYKLAGVSPANSALAAFLQPIPDADELAAKALEAEVRADARLGTTPEERSARFARLSQYAQKATACSTAVLLWGIWYPHPYWLLIAVLTLLPWACLAAMKLFPGILQLGVGNRGSPLRPDVAALLVGPVVVLAIRGWQDVPTLDWQGELRWSLLVAAVFGVALYRAGAAPPRKWSVVLLMTGLCLAYGYGSTVGADALLDRSKGETYRTHVLGKQVTGSGSRSYHLSVAPWRAGAPDTVTVTRDLFSEVTAGDEVCIDVHPGALAVPWYAVGLCPGG